MLAALGALLALLPLTASAFPFGGRASTVLDCVYNSTIYVNLGPPRGGEYIWTTGTKTYQFGPPRSSGQWILGLAAPPYYCIYKISPLTIYTGIAITMMGSSGSAAPPAPPTATGQQIKTVALPSGGSAVPSSGTQSGSSGSTSIGRVVISEVYYNVDLDHGSKPQGEWVELYNGSSATVNLSGWTIRDSALFDALPGGTMLAPGSFLVVGAISATRASWEVPSAQFVSIESPIGDGLSNTGDSLTLRNADGAAVDAVSWGSNSSAFNPAAASVPYGSSLARSTLTKDTNTANDWISRGTPTPGK